MRTLLLVFLFFVGSHQNSAVAQTMDIEAVLTQVLNNTELTRFIYPYVKTLDVLYFRFGPSPVYNDHALENLENITVKIKDGPPLIYDKYQDDKQKPIVTIKILKMTQDTAEVLIGFSIQGAVGKFALIKGDMWIITESDVYQI